LVYLWHVQDTAQERVKSLTGEETEAVVEGAYTARLMVLLEGWKLMEEHAEEEERVREVCVDDMGVEESSASGSAQHRVPLTASPKEGGRVAP
jgi:hypothetical protein